jgi:protein involved in polysaccharide export with SLBB domain
MQKKSDVIRAVLVFAAILIVAAATATAQDEKPAARPSDTAITEALIKKSQSDDTKRYRIGVGDVISVEVAGHPEYSAAAITIPDDGLILLRRIEKPVQTVCKTAPELAAEITQAYKAIFKQPFVRVTVTSYQSQPVAVIGAVEKPGQFNLNRKMRLLEAVAVTGGPNKESGTRIQLARFGKASICEQTDATLRNDDEDLSKLLFSYSLKKTLAGEETANPFLQPGDIVYVSEADRVFVAGNVKEPKPVLLKTPLTVRQAIAAAGGVLPATKKKGIILIRSDEAGNMTKIPVDLLAIETGKQEDPFLKPNDIIQVPIDGRKDNLNNVKKAFMSGLPSVLPFLF